METRLRPCGRRSDGATREAAGRDGHGRDRRLPQAASARRSIAANVGFAVAVVALVIVASVVTDAFLTERNIVSISRQIVTNGFLSLGMLLVILTGGIDLSVGPVLAFAGLLATGLQAHMPFPAAIVVALLMGLAVGFVQRLHDRPLQAAALHRHARDHGQPARPPLHLFRRRRNTPRIRCFAACSAAASSGRCRCRRLLFLVALPIVWFYLNHTISGRAVYAIGVNPEAVRLAGINVRRHIIAAYMASGFLAALAGVLLASRLGIAQPSVGVGYELDAIAAVVIGGGILGGGGGTVLGVFGGVLALAMVDNVLNLFNVESYYQQFLKGVIILVAVLARRKRT